MNTELISIIVPAYNTELYIRETLDSVLAQTYQNWECIIVDDGSTDNTSLIIKEYSDKDVRFKTHYQQNKGASQARNFGIDQANGDYIAFLDSDDIWLPHHLSHSMLMLKKHNVDFVYTKSSYLIDGNLELRYRVKTGRFQGKEFIEHLLRRNEIDTPMVLCKKQTLLECNKFSFHKNAEDFHTWLSLLFNGAVFYSSEEVTGYIRLHENSTSSIDRHCTKEVMEIVLLFKDKIQSLEINYDYYFKHWARKHFLLREDKKHYQKAIKYINTLNPQFFSILKNFAPFLPKKVLKLIALQRLKPKK